MLRYIEFGVSHLEVPGESCLCIYISGCPNRCENCHYVEMQSPDAGLELATYFDDIIDLYREQITCVCFMGEGTGDASACDELVSYARQLKEQSIASCLYSGRDCEIEQWMRVFDFVKVGSYIEELGPLSNKETNQRLFMKDKTGYVDITNKFWE